MSAAAAALFESGHRGPFLVEAVSKPAGRKPVAAVALIVPGAAAASAQALLRCCGWNAPRGQNARSRVSEVAIEHIGEVREPVPLRGAHGDRDDGRGLSLLAVVDRVAGGSLTMTSGQPSR
jgi:hypothetical protein